MAIVYQLEHIVRRAGRQTDRYLPPPHNNIHDDVPMFCVTKRRILWVSQCWKHRAAAAAATERGIFIYYFIIAIFLMLLCGISLRHLRELTQCDVFLHPVAARCRIAPLSVRLWTDSMWQETDAQPYWLWCRVDLINSSFFYHFNVKF